MACSFGANSFWGGLNILEYPMKQNILGSIIMNVLGSQSDLSFVKKSSRIRHSGEIVACNFGARILLGRAEHPDNRMKQNILPIMSGVSIIIKLCPAPRHKSKLLIPGTFKVRISNGKLHVRKMTCFEYNVSLRFLEYREQKFHNVLGGSHL